MNEKSNGNLAYKKYLSILIIVLFLFGLYFPLIDFDFINFDDPLYVSENTFVTTGLTKENIKWAFTNFDSGHWHPLTWLSLQIDAQFFGVTPFVYHLDNIMLFIISAVIFWILLNQLFPQKLLLATLVTLIVFSHPFRLESVAWISERKDLLSLFFGLSAIWAYVVYQKNKTKLNYSAVTFFFLLGLLAKPSLVFLPLVFFVLDWWPLRKIKFSYKEKIFWILISVLFSLIVLFAQNQVGAIRSVSDISFFERIIGSFSRFWMYFYKTFYPKNLSVFYPYQKFSFFISILSLCCFFGISFFSFTKRNKYPYLLFLLAWWVLALLPVIGVIQVGGQLIADRWTLWPHIGMGIAFLGLSEFFARKYSAFLNASLLMLLVICVYKTKIEIPSWQNSETLFQRALKTNQNNFMAHTNLSAYYSSQKKLNLAKHHAEIAVNQNSSYPPALNNLGKQYALQGNHVAAEKLFKKALLINTDMINVRYNLALSRYHLGKKKQAIQDWVLVFVSNPHYKAVSHSLNYVIQNDLLKECKQDFINAVSQKNPVLLKGIDLNLCIK